MPNFIPASHSFNYTQNTPQNIADVFVSYTNLTTATSFINGPSVLSAPNWLTVLNVGEDNSGTFSLVFTLRLNKIVADTMVPGVYQANLKLRYRIKTSSRTTDETFPVTLNITESNLLSLSPSVIPFEYNIGGPLPQNKIMQISSDYNWNITPSQTWISVAPPSGLGNASAVVSVNPSGLPVGYYEGNVLVQDQLNNRSVAIALNITGQDTQTDFLYITPQNLEFLSEFQVPNPTLKSLSIEASGNWTITKNVAWITLSTASGIAGTTSINISVDSELLAEGTFTAPITITMGDIIKQVFIQVTVLQFFTSGIASETLYFAKDRNKLSVSSIQDNTYLQLDISASTQADVLTYTQEAPYFKGVAAIVIGEETEVLLKSFKPSKDLFSVIRNNIKPIVYQVAASNLNKINNNVSVIQNFSNLNFLRGKTPSIANKLCYIPNTVTITANAKLSLSVLADVFPGNLIVTGAINHEISGSLSDNLYVYNAILDLSGLGLVKGDTIQITFGTLVINGTIQEPQPEENIIAFENEWGEYEFFNTTGFLTKTDAIKKISTELAIEAEKQTKIVSIDAGAEYTLNTGYIYTQEEKDWLTKILEAKRVFLYEDTDFTEIILTTTKLQRYQTREHIASYNLQFKKAII